MSREMQTELQEIEREIYAVVGHEFNIGSPQQLSQVLFEELGLPKTRRTKLGYTTDALAMDELRGAHPVVDLIMRYRGISKLKSTYVDALPALINPKTKRIHTTFNQATRRPGGSRRTTRTCRTSRCARATATASGTRSSRATSARSRCCSRRTTRRSSCGSWRT